MLWFTGFIRGLLNLSYTMELSSGKLSEKNIIRLKAQVSIPGQASKTKYEKIFLRRFLLSRYPAKTLRVNKPAIKKFLKNLSFRSDVPPLTYEIITHNMSCVGS